MNKDKMEVLDSPDRSKLEATSKRAVINAFLLVAQPLALNALSLIAMAYIARKLGRDHYGIFVYALALVALFEPLASLGLRPVFVRELAGDRTRIESHLGTMLPLRLLLGALACLAVFAVINMLNVSDDTRIAVYIASFMLISRSVTTTLLDTFQAIEKMHRIASVNLTAGLLLTLCSMLVLYCGHGVNALLLVYSLAGFLSLALAAFYLRREKITPRVVVDKSDWIRRIKQAFPFLYPNLLEQINTRAGIILLSAFSGPASVASYGVASTLIERLIIIPDGVCTAIFPAMASSYKESTETITILFHKFLTILLLIGLPIALGTTILARPIITFIYGDSYQGSTAILQVLSWYILSQFLVLILYWTLGAVNQQPKAANVTLLITPINIISVTFLTYKLSAIGLAIATTVSCVVALIMLIIAIKDSICWSDLEIAAIRKICASSMLMGIAVWFCKDFHPMISVSAGVISYVAANIVLRTFGWSELVNVKHALTNKKVSAAAV